MRFVSLEPSTRSDKKYMIEFDEPKKTIHFGSRNSKTYLDHKDKTKRYNYLRRHFVREDWSNPLTPGALSAFLLWGFSTDLTTNLKTFLKRFNISQGSYLS